MNALDVYAGLWGAAVFASAALAFRYRDVISLISRDYALMLFTPWRLVTAAIGIAAMVIAGPWSNDPFWDPWNGLFMSVLTYLTAPWAIGTLYRAMRRQAALADAFIAVCLALFSASWSFDLYWLVRSGAYPIVWDLNLLASGTLYVAAGLFWSLEHRPECGVIFGFMASPWPAGRGGSRFADVWWIAVPLMAFVVALNAIAFV